MPLKSQQPNTRMHTGHPVLSLLICSRNDRYQGNSVWRLQTALNCTAENIHDVGRERDVEIVVIDWGSDTPLSAVLQLNAAASAIVSFLYVPRDIANEVRRDSPFPEVIALNAGVRRAKGEYIGRIDQDTVLGPHFLKTFFRMYEKPMLLVPLERALLLANRRRIPYRLAVRCPADRFVNAFIRRVGRWLILMDPLPPHLFYQSYVGIWLLHRNIWFECGGYDERFIYMDWQEVDMILRLTPAYTLINLGELTNHDLYHLDHGHPREPWSASRNRKANPVRNLENLPEKVRPNDESWGLARYSLSVEPYHAGSVGAVSEKGSAWEWLGFSVALGISGIQMLWDNVLLVTVIPARKWLEECGLEWRRRFDVVREIISGQPILAWPKLLFTRWAKRFH